MHLVLNIILWGFLVVLVLLLVWPQKITFHFDMSKLFIEYSCVVWKWRLTRETKSFQKKFSRFMKGLVPQELISSLEIPKPTAKEVFDFSRHIVDDVVQTVGPQIFKKEESETPFADEDIASLQESTQHPKESPSEESSYKEPLQEDSVSAKVSVNHQESTLHQVSVLLEEEEESSFSEAMENLSYHWKQERKFLLTLLKWVIKILKQSAKLITPTRIWLKVEGGVDDPKETADLWIYSRIIGNLFKQVWGSVDFVFTPQFTLNKRWSASGEVVLEFNILRIIGDILYVFLTFPYIPVLLFYLRWRRKTPLRTDLSQA